MSRLRLPDLDVAGRSQAPLPLIRVSHLPAEKYRGCRPSVVRGSAGGLQNRKRGNMKDTKPPPSRHSRLVCFFKHCVNFTERASFVKFGFRVQKINI